MWKCNYKYILIFWWPPPSPPFLWLANMTPSVTLRYFFVPRWSLISGILTQSFVMICFRRTTKPFFQGFPRISQLKTKGFPEKSFQSSTPTKKIFKAAIKKKNFCQIPCHHACPSSGTLLLTVDATHVFKRRYLGICAKRNVRKKRQNVYRPKQTKGKISPNMHILSNWKNLVVESWSWFLTLRILTVENSSNKYIVKSPIFKSIFLSKYWGLHSKWRCRRLYIAWG